MSLKDKLKNAKPTPFFDDDVVDGWDKWVETRDAIVRADAIDECKQILLDAMARDGKTKCHEYMVALNEMEQLKR